MSARVPLLKSQAPRAGGGDKHPALESCTVAHSPMLLLTAFPAFVALLATMSHLAYGGDPLELATTAASWVTAAVLDVADALLPADPLAARAPQARSVAVLAALAYAAFVLLTSRVLRWATLAAGVAWSARVLSPDAWRALSGAVVDAARVLAPAAREALLRAREALGVTQHGLQYEVATYTSLAVVALTAWGVLPAAVRRRAVRTALTFAMIAAVFASAGPIYASLATTGAVTLWTCVRAVRRCRIGRALVVALLLTALTVAAAWQHAARTSSSSGSILFRAAYALLRWQALALAAARHGLGLLDAVVLRAHRGVALAADAMAPRAAAA